MIQRISWLPYDPMVVIPFVYQIGSDASNLITMPITPNNGTAVQNVSIGFLNFQLICNKSEEISDVVKDMAAVYPQFHLQLEQKTESPLHRETAH